MCRDTASAACGRWNSNDGPKPLRRRNTSARACSAAVVTTFLWVGSYILRVATKDMTYAKQLKDYENAVIAKRLEELDEDEIQALVEDIERDDF